MNQTPRQSSERLRLHIGSGEKRLPGWTNVDIRPFPGVDVVTDVTEGLEFENVEAVYAEHFLEHLPLGKALDFLAEVHRVLADDGRLRLSTPNLDWVWSTHYRLEADPETKRSFALHLNRAFHGWEHKFLWNRELLGRVLELTGFEGLTWCRYGESEVVYLRGIERHEISEDAPDLPHVVIVEATKGTPRLRELAELRARLQREFLDHVEQGY